VKSLREELGTVQPRSAHDSNSMLAGNVNDVQNTLESLPSEGRTSASYSHFYRSLFNVFICVSGNAFIITNIVNLVMAVIVFSTVTMMTGVSSLREVGAAICSLNVQASDFTALHGMQTGSSDEDSVRPSV